VSWIRKRDLHVLTGGIITYTTDPRFHLRHEGDDGEVESWVMRITNLTREDSGLYECQVNTEPKKSLAFKLYVSGTLYSAIYYYCNHTVLAIILD
jgi:hypothetical protein